MSLFGKKEKQEEPIVEQEKNTELDMLVSTADIIEKPYESIGLVTATLMRNSISDAFDPKDIAMVLTKKAREKGADAIIGFRYEVRKNSASGYNEIAYGTAVKLK